jgi:hypothetical protein
MSEAVAELARANLVQLRLTGLLLETLIARNVLTRSEAAALIHDACGHLHDDCAMLKAYRGLADEVLKERPLPMQR